MDKPVTVKLQYDLFNFSKSLLEYINWCIDNQIQWIPVYNSDSTIRQYPDHARFSEEDALAFKLRFGL